jgi:cytochrome c biogenesis protein CcdA
MQGLRKLLRALLILTLPIVAALVFAQASTGTEVAVGALLIAFALGLIATWFWQPL